MAMKEGKTGPVIANIALGSDSDFALLQKEYRRNWYDGWVSLLEKWGTHSYAGPNETAARAYALGDGIDCPLG